MVCVSRLLDNSYDLTIICRKNAADWSIRVPQGQWGNGFRNYGRSFESFNALSSTSLNQNAGSSP